MNIPVIVSGPSASGKSSLMSEVMANEVVTMTTRDIRINDGEVDGIHYYFVTKAQFEKNIKENRMIEYNQYLGEHYYGITKEKLEEQLKKGETYAVVDYNGMVSYKKIYPEAITIFIYSSLEDTMKQLNKRGDSKSEREKRLAAYEFEMENSHHYDFVVKNEFGKFDETVQVLKEIIHEGKKRFL